MRLLKMTAVCLGVTWGLAAQNGPDCSGFSYSQLHSALVEAVVIETSGLNNNMWATLVDRDGVVCAVTFSGKDRGSQWPGSRAISAQKANTANAFSLDSSSASNESGQPNGLALSTANLYSPVQPGGSLFGLQASNPVDTHVAYRGNPMQYGTENDPMVGYKIGGVNVFGGGLALYNAQHQVVGGLGVSGDTSCADHDIAWRVRHILGLDHLGSSCPVTAEAKNANACTPGVGGVTGDPMHPDNIIYDITPNPYGGTGISAGGYGHPTCGPSTLMPPSSLPAVIP